MYIVRLLTYLLYFWNFGVLGWSWIYFFYHIISVSKHTFPWSPELRTNQNWLYEICENNMHVKYSGFTVYCSWWDLLGWGGGLLLIVLWRIRNTLCLHYIYMFVFLPNRSSKYRQTHRQTDRPKKVCEKLSDFRKGLHVQRRVVVNWASTSEPYRQEVDVKSITCQLASPALPGALRGEICRSVPLAPLSFLASRSLNPKMNTLPHGESLPFFKFA